MRDHPKIGEVAVIQEWAGYVVEIVGDECVARLVDVTAGSSHDDEEAVIPLSALSGDDADSLRPGSIFRWVIGYERSASHTKKPTSKFVFLDRRITERDIQEGRRWARKTKQAFGL